MNYKDISRESTIVALAGIGTVIYFATKKEGKTETNSPKQEKSQQLQKQLSQIQTFLDNLNRKITQTESTLNQKKTQQQQNPSNSNLPSEINQLEQQLTTYKNQKLKLETVLPKLEKQIKNLGEGNLASEKIIQELEKEIEEINKELGIEDDKPKKDKPDEKKPEKEDKRDNPDENKKKDYYPKEVNKPNPPPVSDLTQSTQQDYLNDLKLIKDYLQACNKHNEANKENLTKTEDGQLKYQADKNKYMFALDDIMNEEKWLKYNSSNQPEIAKNRTEFRKKWNNIFKDLPKEDKSNNDNPEPEENPQPQPNPIPDPQPTPEEEWEKNKSTLISNAKETIKQVIRTVNLYWLKNDQYKYPDWEDKLKNTSSKAELNALEEEILNNINELKMASPTERLNLKDYFIFQLKEIGFYWPDGTWNVRSIEDSLKTDLNQVIKGNPNSSWERKYITLINFGINSKDKGTKFDKWIVNNINLYIVISKKHDSKFQFKSERNHFYLKKTEPDYHEFKTRKEAIEWLRQNDSYFKS